MCSRRSKKKARTQKKPNDARKMRRRKIVEENENSNYNKNHGRVKKEYIHPVRTIKIEINYKDQYTQQEKLKEWFKTSFFYNKCVSYCLLAS